MDFLFDPIKEIFIEMITNTLLIIADALDTSSGKVNKIPSQWNPEIYNFIYEISSNVILPIGGMILTLIACYELITMTIEKNNMNDFYTQDLFKWIFKTAISVIILTNMFTFTEGIFEVAQELVTQINTITSTSPTIPDLSSSVDSIVDTLDDMSLGELMLLQLQTVLMWLGVFIINSFILPLIVTSRMLHIYVMMVLSPIPFATFGNREWSNIGQNYVKSLCAVALQVVLMEVCFNMYDILISTSITGSDPIWNVTLSFGYGLLLVFMLWKTGAIAKSILQAH